MVTPFVPVLKAIRRAAKARPTPEQCRSSLTMVASGGWCLPVLSLDNVGANANGERLAVPPWASTKSYPARAICGLIAWGRQRK
jgi:hypothetical protein